MATKKKSLLDKVAEQEAVQEEVKLEKKPSPVKKITSNDGYKDKQISAKINSISWKNFTEINKIQGLSNNSAINMLINKYIRENKEILED